MRTWSLTSSVCWLVCHIILRNALSQWYEHCFRLESVLDYGDTISGSHTILVANSTGHNHHFSTDDHSIGPVVDRQRAEQLASNYLIPFFEVDFQQDAQSVDFVVNMLVTMVMTRALDNRLLTQTIRPYNSKVEQLVAKESGRCVGCCSMWHKASISRLNTLNLDLYALTSTGRLLLE